MQQTPLKWGRSPLLIPTYKPYLPLPSPIITFSTLSEMRNIFAFHLQSCYWLIRYLSELMTRQSLKKVKFWLSKLSSHQMQSATCSLRIHLTSSRTTCIAQSIARVMEEKHFSESSSSSMTMSVKMQWTSPFSWTRSTRNIIAPLRVCFLCDLSILVLIKFIRTKIIHIFWYY